MISFLLTTSQRETYRFLDPFWPDFNERDMGLIYYPKIFQNISLPLIWHSARFNKKWTNKEIEINLIWNFFYKFSKSRHQMYRIASIPYCVISFMKNELKNVSC